MAAACCKTKRVRAVWSTTIALLRIAKRLRKKAIVYGQSVGPLSEKGRAQLRYALKDVPVAVRDEGVAKAVGQP